METKWVWNSILEATVGNEPAEAVRLAVEKGLPLDKLAASWVKKDAGAVMAYSRQIADPAARMAFLDAGLASLTTTDPAAAFTQAGTLPPGPARSYHLTRSLAALARENQDAARTAIDSLPAGPDRAVALTSLAAALSDRDEAAAVSLLATIRWNDINTGSPAGRVKDEAAAVNYSPAREVIPSIQQLMTVAPAATVNTLAALPPHPDIPIAPAIQRWAGLQPEAASLWVRAQPAGPVRDQAIAGLTAWLTRVSPEPDFAAALTWAATASPDLQASLYWQTVAAWKREDRAAALAAARQLPLPPDHRARLLQLFD